MALGSRRRDRGGLDVWPGYVDALSTLLMVIIFVLLVFVLAQGFLSVTLSSRDRALDRLNRQVAELSELLALERGQAEELRSSLARNADELRGATAARDSLTAALAALREERDRLITDRDGLRQERDRLTARITDLGLAAGSGSARIAELEGRLAEALARVEAAGGDTATTTRSLTETQRALAAERAALEAVRRDLAATRQQVATLDRDLLTERAARGDAERALSDTRGTLAGVERALVAEREARAGAERARDVNAASLAAMRQEAAALARDLAAARTSLEAARRDLAALEAEAARLDQTVLAERETIALRLSDIARLSNQVAALEALRDQLEREAQAALARAGEEAGQRQSLEQALSAAQQALDQALAQASTAEAARRQEAARAAAAEAAGLQAAARADAAEVARREATSRAAAAEASSLEATSRAAAAEVARQQEASRAAAAALLAAEAQGRAAAADRARGTAESERAEFARLSESARAQVALLTRQLEALRSELSRVAAALEAAEDAGRDKDAEIVALGQRLNVALAARVEELQRYRSDFFGRLRNVLGDRPEVRIVGDRFVFQSEVLFPVGSADLSPLGAQQVRALGRVLLDISTQIPGDIAWVLRVDGHADRSPIRGTGGRFATNWELSAARSIAVAQLLIAEGLPANRVAAAAFGDTQPLDPADTPEAFARNRRIELRLEAGPTAARAASAASADPLRAMACARLGPGAAPVGIAQRAALAALPAEVRRRAATVTPFEGPYCGILASLDGVDAQAMRIEAVGGGRLARGDLLRVDVTLPAWPAHLTLVSVANDGQVVPLVTLPAQPPGARLRLGEPRGDFAGWQVQEPLGTDLVLAIASEGPLFAALRPQTEPTAPFAEALRTALADARAAGRRVSAAAMILEVTP
jgi:chemotaxis protein MotB